MGRNFAVQICTVNIVHMVKGEVYCAYTISLLRIMVVTITMDRLVVFCIDDDGIIISANFDNCPYFSHIHVASRDPSLNFGLHAI